MARAASVLRTTTPERVSVLEIKVDILDEKIDSLKEDIKNIHECITEQNEKMLENFKLMRDENQSQHDELAGKVKDLETFKNKWTNRLLMALAFLAGAGWLGQVNLTQLFKFLIP